MAKYCQEKFEHSPSGTEVIVCWREDRHVHNAALITAIEQWLARTAGIPGTWMVRANSYQSNLQSCSVKAKEYTP